MEQILSPGDHFFYWGMILSFFSLNLSSYFLYLAFLWPVLQHIVTPYLIDILQIAPKLNNTFLLNLNLSKAPFSEERHLSCPTCLQSWTDVLCHAYCHTIQSKTRLILNDPDVIHNRILSYKNLNSFKIVGRKFSSMYYLNLKLLLQISQSRKMANCVCIMFFYTGKHSPKRCWMLNGI